MNRADHPFRRTLRPSRPAHARLIDCGSLAYGEPSCGVCDQCVYEQTMFRADHPASLSHEELAHL